MIFKQSPVKRVLRVVFNRLSFGIFLWITLYMLPVVGQDSIPTSKSISEEKALTFQHSFFNALTEKSINNYQKAVVHLENCNQITPNNPAVLFEFSKNYLFLNKATEARGYVQKALETEPKNIWMLKHLIAIEVSENNFTEAIALQEKLAINAPEENIYLIELYLKNEAFDNAISLFNKLDKEMSLPSSLRKKVNAFSKSGNEDEHEIEKVVKTDEVVSADIESIQQQFENSNSFDVLKKLLFHFEKNLANTDDLLAYSDKGIALYPAQPLVYFMKAKALIKSKNYQVALETLKNGLDFVFEDAMERNFYVQMAVCYNELGQLNNEKKYMAKAQKIKI